MEIPSTSSLADQNLTALEAALGQTAPVNELAFLRVLAVLLAMADTGLYRYAYDRARQNLALTATGASLDTIGEEHDAPRKLAERAQLMVTVAALDGLSLEVGVAFVSSANGMRYLVDTSTVAENGELSALLSAELAGAIGNLANGSTLTIVSEVPGVGAQAVVTQTVNTGADDETDAEYRPRVLFAIRAVRGGGNATDHRVWSEEVAGVHRAFPYAGKPFGSVEASYPADRTVYVEASTSVDPDGIPGVGLLAEVRAALLIDPETGKGRPALGLTDSTLYVEPISRPEVDITLTGLTAPGGNEATLRAAIESAWGVYLRTMAPYIEGVDAEDSRNDQLTEPSLSAVMQGVLTTYGASASAIEFTVADTPYTTYSLDPGQLLKLGTVTYV